MAPEPYNPTSLVYPNAYYPAENADELWEAFQQIINTITNTAKGPTKVENDDPVHSGYLTYTDPIGEYMEVKQVKSILWAGIQFKLEAGYTATPVPQPDGGTLQTYTGHFETDSGGKTFDSPVYGRGNVDDILITVRTDASGRQTLQAAVPASAIPIRVNTITLDVDNTPVDNQNNNAFPLRLCYTVGLRDGVVRPDGTLNTDPDQGGVSAAYLADHTVDGQVCMRTTARAPSRWAAPTRRSPRRIPTPSTSCSSPCPSTWTRPAPSGPPAALTPTATTISWTATTPASVRRSPPAPGWSCAAAAA